MRKTSFQVLRKTGFQVLSKVFKRNTAGILAATLLLTGAATGLSGCGTQKEKSTSSSGAAKSSSEKLTTIKVGLMTGNIDSWLIPIGEDKGFFKKYGLKTETTQFAAGINTVDAIVTGQNDVGMLADYAAINRFGNTTDSTDLRIITEFYSTDTDDYLYVNPDKVKKLSDLSGQGIAAIPGTVYEYWMEKTYEKAGVKEADRKPVNISSGQEGLAAIKKGDAVAMWASGENARKCQEAGMKKLICLTDLNTSIDGYFISTKSYIDKNEKQVEGFLKAVKDTEDWIQKNQKEAAALAYKYSGLPKDQFEPTLKSVDLLDSIEQKTIDHLNVVKKWAFEAGKFKKDYNVEDYIDKTPLEKAGIQ